MRTKLAAPNPRFLLLLPSLLLIGCAGAGVITRESRLDMHTRVMECRALDAKVTSYGTQGAIGAFLSGGTGLAAALPDDGKARNWIGALSLVSGIYSSATQYLATRNSERFGSRACATILGPDLQSAYFQEALAVQRDPVFGQRLRTAIADSIRSAVADSVRRVVVDSVLKVGADLTRSLQDPQRQ